MKIRQSYLKVVHFIEREVITPCLHWVKILIISGIFHVQIKLISFGEPPPRGFDCALKLAAVPTSDAIGYRSSLH
jgi:hypothetical protein